MKLCLVRIRTTLRQILVDVALSPTDRNIVTYVTPATENLLKEFFTVYGVFKREL